MADHHAGKRRVLQKRLQPLDSGKIQMVGGLVEQQDVRRLHQPFGDRQAFAPAAGERRRGRSKSVKPARPSVSAMRAARSVWRNVRAIKRRSITDRTVSLGANSGNLRHAAKPGALADGHFAGVRLHAAVKNLEQRRFARAVRPDQADALAFGNRERDILEKRRGAVSFRKSLCSDNRRQMIRFSPASSVA